MDERRLAALETLGAVVKWLKETKPSEIFYIEGEGKGKAPAPTMSDGHLRVIWQCWVAKASDVLERSAVTPTCSWAIWRCFSRRRAPVPRRQEHLKAARALLGHADPLVHLLMDRAIERLGPRHRYVSHNAEYIGMIRHLLGEEAALEATLHLLQDWGMVVAQDYSFSYPPRRRVHGGQEDPSVQP